MRQTKTKGDLLIRPEMKIIKCLPNVVWKALWSCDMDTIVILRLSNPKNAPNEIRPHSAHLISETKMYLQFNRSYLS